jgi:hypothetical protein
LNHLTEAEVEGQARFIDPKTNAICFKPPLFSCNQIAMN